MPKVRILAPTTDKDGKPLAAGQEVDVDEEDFARLRSQGTASAIEDEEAAAKAAKEEGSFTARATREGTGQAEGQPQPQPQQTRAQQPEEKKK